ncbi:putative transglutaminase-like cysteine proteinase [Labrenzia sp. EL_126]|nr:putative transglutaminase-like cysteine proteinase [Labrenzia sp. EL_126]
MISKNKWKETLIEVNTRVNEEIRFVAEPEGQDHWKPAMKTGDCEDYAILKRRELVAAGVPASSMRFAMVENDRYGLHVVLVVRTTDGDRVLDNTTDTIWPAHKTSFNWLSIQSRWNPRKWLKVAN